MSEATRLQGSPAAMNVTELNESIWQAWQVRNAGRDRRNAAAWLAAVKCASLAVLLITTVLWGYVGAYHVAIRFALAVGAVVVAGQTWQSRRYLYALIFLATAVIYNPIVATFPMTGGWPLPLVFVTVVAFSVSLFWPRDEPRSGRSTLKEAPSGKTGVSAWENEGGASEGLEPEPVSEQRKGAAK